MLLEKLYTRKLIKEKFEQIKEAMQNDSEFKEETDIAARLLYEKLEKKYPDIEVDELKQIILFGMGVWSPEEVIKASRLNFCNQCGTCCTDIYSPVILPDEVENYLNDPYFKNNIKKKGAHYQFIQENPCKYYNKSTSQCTIYEVRPFMCRNYPIGSGTITVNPKCNNAIEITKIKIENLIERCKKHDSGPLM